jgi:hypothetical protein
VNLELFLKLFYIFFDFWLEADQTYFIYLSLTHLWEVGVILHGIHTAEYFAKTNVLENSYAVATTGIRPVRYAGGQQ